MKRNILITLGFVLATPSYSSYSYANCNKTLGVPLIDKNEKIEERRNKRSQHNKCLVFIYEIMRVLIVALAVLIGVLTVTNYHTDTTYEVINPNCTIGEEWVCPSNMHFGIVNSQYELGLITQITLSCITVLFSLFDGAKGGFNSCFGIGASSCESLSKLVGETFMTGGKLWASLGELIVGSAILLGYEFNQEVLKLLSANSQETSYGQYIAIANIILSVMLFVICMMEYITLK